MPDLGRRADASGGVYIGGTFTTVGGVAGGYLAHILSKRALHPGFAPILNGSVGEAAVWERIGQRGQPEVDDLQVPVVGHRQVLGLEIAMDDALLVDLRDCVAGLDGVIRAPGAR